MQLLRVMEQHLPIGSEGWKSVVCDHEMGFLGSNRAVLMRKCSTLHQKQMPTGDPDCPKEVKLAKQTKHVIGNKAAEGDSEEEFNPEEVDFSESSSNPNPEPSDIPEEDGVTTRTVTLSSTMKEKRASCRTATEEREAKKDEFIKMHRFDLLSTQEGHCVPELIRLCLRVPESTVIAFS